MGLCDLQRRMAKRKRLIREGGTMDKKPHSIERNKKER